jgi:hypothetical protein
MLQIIIKKMNNSSSNHDFIVTTNFFQNLISYWIHDFEKEKIIKTLSN